ncbi:MAG: tripartite tricarboxylate transporter TctB family protein [Flavobacteriales bacterium]
MKALKKLARVLMYLSRIVVGSVFVVSGLIKANDALGFSYKLEEYFEPAALGGFWTMFADYALPLAILVCVAEVVLGLSLIFGTRYKLTVIKITGFLIFFGFLTYYTAQCDPHEMVTYVTTNAEGVEETVTTERQCVLDCGCFGDALKGSLGRSLEPIESFQKDMVLLILSIFLFFGWKTEKLNNERKDKILITGSLIFTGVFGGLVFGWWMPVAFLAIASILYLLIKWFYVKKGRDWVIIAMLIAMSSIFIWYTLTYLPVKDYRPYAVGNNIPELMKTSDDYKNEISEGMYASKLAGHQTEIQNQLNSVLNADSTYQDSATSEMDKQDIKQYALEEIEYSFKEMYSAQIDSLVYDSMKRANLLPSIYYSLYYLQNKKTKERDYFKSTDYMTDKMWVDWEFVYILVNEETGEEIEVLKSEYKEEAYPGYKKKTFKTETEYYGHEPKVLDFRFDDSDSLTNHILHSENYVLLVVSWDLNLAKTKAYSKVNELYNWSNEKGYSFVAATSKLDLADSFIENNNLDFGFVSGDDKVLKTIVRSNPGVLLIKGGIIYGKWDKNRIPTPEKMQKYIGKLK